MQEQLVPRPFDQNLQPVTSAGMSCCADVFNQVQNFERKYETRKRARKKKDQQIFQQTVYCIVSNLVIAELKFQERGIRITRSHGTLGKRDRYRAPVLGKTFPYVIDVMNEPEMGLLKQKKAEPSVDDTRHQSIIFPTVRIDTRINELDLSVHDFGPSDLSEVIILKGKKEDYFDKVGYASYEDTPDTVRMREEMVLLNDWLSHMDIQLVSSDPYYQKEIKYIQIHNRKLRRFFTRGDRSFKSGGRLFGGFWLDMNKAMRRNTIYLDEENTCTLDYKNMAPRILYGLAEAEIDQDDAYTIRGYEAYRSGIKTVFNTMINKNGPLSKFPKGVKKEFERNHTIQWVSDAIRKRHKPIAKFLDTEIGHAIQKIESDIIVKCMLLCKERDIPVLPIHDALLFPFDKETEGREIMKRVFKEYTGIEGIINKEE